MMSLLDTLAPISHAEYPGYPSVWSPDRSMRYTLWRTGLGGVGYACIVGANPSIAADDRDDPTMTRVQGFARGWGVEALCMVNAQAAVSTEPKALARMADPIGPDNYEWIMRVAPGASIVVVAFGKIGGRSAPHVVSMLRAAGIKLQCLGRNQDGTPKHPLFLKGTTPLQEYT